MRNIVEPNLAHFEQLYAPVLNELEPLCAWGPRLGEGAAGDAAEFARSAATARCQQDMSPAARERLAEALPATLRRGLSAAARAGAGAGSSAEIQAVLSGIVARSAKSQSLKGILTAGVVKSGVYTAAKIGKWWGGVMKRGAVR